LRFYRGISVAEDERDKIVSNIKNEGLKIGDLGAVEYGTVDLREQISKLINLPDLTTGMTRQPNRTYQQNVDLDEKIEPFFL
jgi:hypothetical protein